MSDQTKPTSQRLSVASEWTVTDFGLVKLNGKDMVTALTYDQGKALVDAIKVALTSEREKVSDRHKLCVDYEMKWKAEREKSRILGNMIDGVDGTPGLRQQLTAEREKHEQFKRDVDVLISGPASFATIQQLQDQLAKVGK